MACELQKIMQDPWVNVTSVAAHGGGTSVTVITACSSQTETPGHRHFQ